MSPFFVVLFGGLISDFGGMRVFGASLLAILWALACIEGAISHGDQPLAKIAIHNAKFALHDQAYVKASPTVLGLGVRFNCIIWS